MTKFKHRVAMNVDLFMTIETDSAGTPQAELEKAAIATWRDFGCDHGSTLSDVGIGLDLGSCDAVLYMRHNDDDCPTDDEDVRLDNFSVQNIDEVEVKPPLKDWVLTAHGGNAYTLAALASLARGYFVDFHATPDPIYEGGWRIDIDSTNGNGQDKILAACLIALQESCNA